MSTKSRREVNRARRAGRTMTSWPSFGRSSGGAGGACACPQRGTSALLETVARNAEQALRQHKLRRAATPVGPFQGAFGAAGFARDWPTRRCV